MAKYDPCVYVLLIKSICTIKYWFVALTIKIFNFVTWKSIYRLCVLKFSSTLEKVWCGYKRWFYGTRNLLGFIGWYYDEYFMILYLSYSFIWYYFSYFLSFTCLFVNQRKVLKVLIYFKIVYIVHWMYFKWKSKKYTHELHHNTLQYNTCLAITLSLVHLGSQSIKLSLFSSAYEL